MAQRLIEKMELHDTLNPKLWENNQLRPEVEEKLDEIIDQFILELQVNEIPIKVLDARLVGSNASFNYTDNSDLDIHIIANFADTSCDVPVLNLLYNYFKKNFNDKYEISIHGVPVELYVEDMNLSSVSNGVYSLYKKEWIKFPEPIEIPDIDITDTFTPYEEKYREIIDNPNAEKASDLIDELYLLRKDSISTDGEYGEGNLVFKEFRNKGYLDNLKQLLVDETSKELSLESLNDSNDNNNNVENIKKYIKNNFNISTYTVGGPFYILSNGLYLNLGKNGSHLGLDDELYQNEIIEQDPFDYSYSYPNTIMVDLFNAIRCSDGENLGDGEYSNPYIQLPKNLPTNAQINSLDDWINSLGYNNKLFVDGVEYNLSEVSSEYIIKRIKRYYSSGRLYESSNSEEWLNESKEDNQKLIDHVGEEIAQKFFKLKPRIKSPQNDLYYWLKKEPVELQDFLDELESTKSKTQIEREAKQGAKLLYNKNGWKIYRIDTYEAATYYGKNTKWCISGNYPGSEGQGQTYFDNYKDNGVIDYYFIISPDNHKWCYLHTENDFEDSVLWNEVDDGFTDIRDDEIPDFPADAMEVMPGFKEHFKEVSTAEQRLRSTVIRTHVLDYTEETRDTLKNYSTVNKPTWLTDYVDKLIIHKDCETVRNEEFLYMDHVQEIIIEDGITGIGVASFALCTRLTKVYIPNTVKVIARKAFAGCYELKKIYIPSSVEYMGDSAFAMCNDDLTIYCGIEEEKTIDKYNEIWNIKDMAGDIKDPYNYYDCLFNVKRSSVESLTESVFNEDNKYIRELAQEVVEIWNNTHSSKLKLTSGLPSNFDYVKAYFILPDGGFLYGFGAHYEIEEVLQSIGKSNYSDQDFIESVAESTLQDLGCIRGRIDRIENYIEIPNKRPTIEQFDGIEAVLDFEQEHHIAQIIDIGVYMSGSFNSYFFDEETTDELIKKVKRYYSSGTLYESSNLKIFYNFPDKVVYENGDQIAYDPKTTSVVEWLNESKYSDIENLIEEAINRGVKPEDLFEKPYDKEVDAEWFFKTLTAGSSEEYQNQAFTRIILNSPNNEFYKVLLAYLDSEGTGNKNYKKLKPASYIIKDRKIIPTDGRHRAQLCILLDIDLPVKEYKSENKLNEGRDAPLYHATSIQNLINILNNNTLKTGRLYAKDVLKGKKTGSISLTRSKEFANRYTNGAILILDQSKLINNYKLTPVGDNVNILGNTPTRRDYNSKAEEIIEKNISPLNNYLLGIEINLKLNKESKNIIDNYCNQHNIPVTYTYLNEEDEEKGDWGYHYGDLGNKADRRNNFGIRNSGGFGTGTYFVGTPISQRKDGSFYKNRPEHKIDFSKYNLFKPRSNEQAYKLHDALLAINNMAVDFDEAPPTWRSVLDEFDKVFNAYYAPLDALDDNDYITPVKLNIKPLEKYIRKYNIKKYYPYELEKDDDLMEVAREITNNRIKEARAFEDILHKLSSGLGYYNDDKLRRIIIKALQDKSDIAPSTLIMKDLGYEGIDVRHLNYDAQGLSGLDNFKFGSVIYDLKESIEETGRTVIKAVVFHNEDQPKKQILNFQDFEIDGLYKLGENDYIVFERRWEEDPRGWGMIHADIIDDFVIPVFPDYRDKYIEEAGLEIDNLQPNNDLYYDLKNLNTKTFSKYINIIRRAINKYFT